MEKLPAIKAFVGGITASVVGAISGAIVIFKKKSLIDISTVLIALIARFILWKFKKITKSSIIIGCAIVGIFLRY